MSKFLKQTELEPLWDNLTGLPLYNHDCRRLYNVLVFPDYQSDVAGKTITNDDNKPPYISDLGSVPRIPFVYDAIGEIAIEPYIIHDICYSKGLFTRKMADDILLEALALVGIPWWKRYQIYLGVRIGGAGHFCTS